MEWLDEIQAGNITRNPLELFYLLRVENIIYETMCNLDITYVWSNDYLQKRRFCKLENRGI